MKMTLTAVCDFQGGTQPPKNEWIDHEANGYVRMLQIRDFTQSEKDNIEYVKDTKNLKKCNENDILIGRYGASVGKILTGLSGAYNVAIVKAIPDTEKIFARYLYYFFTSPYFQNFIKSVGSRAAQTGFNKDDLKNAVIPLISTDEQHKIAAVLDKVSSLIAKRRQQLDKLDELVKAKFVEMFGDPVTNPKGWKIDQLGSYMTTLTDFSANGSYELLDSNVVMYDEPNYAVMVRTIDLEAGNLDSGVKYIDQQAYELLSKSKLYGGELIMNKIGSAGKIYIMPHIGKPASLGRNAFMFRFDERINMVFLYALLTSDYGKVEIQQYVRGAVTKTITKASTKAIRIIVPPIELQNQFAAFVEQTEKTKITISKSLEKLETLKKALMQKYFG